MNMPLKMVVEHFIRYVVAVQMAFYVLQVCWRNQDMHTAKSFVPEIQL